MSDVNIGQAFWLTAGLPPSMRLRDFRATNRGDLILVAIMLPVCEAFKFSKFLCPSDDSGRVHIISGSRRSRKPWRDSAHELDATAWRRSSLICPTWWLACACTCFEFSCRVDTLPVICRSFFMARPRTLSQPSTDGPRPMLASLSWHRHLCGFRASSSSERCSWGLGVTSRSVAQEEPWKSDLKQQYFLEKDNKGNSWLKSREGYLACELMLRCCCWQLEWGLL